MHWTKPEESLHPEPYADAQNNGLALSAYLGLASTSTPYMLPVLDFPSLAWSVCMSGICGDDVDCCIQAAGYTMPEEREYGEGADDLALFFGSGYYAIKAGYKVIS
jgi:hypothetical protein